MASLISDYIRQFSNYYTQSKLKRFLSGLGMIGIITGIASIVSIALRPLFQENDTLQTFLEDLPWIGLIVAIIIGLEIWGLIPSSTVKEQETNEKLNDSSLKNGGEPVVSLSETNMKTE